MSIKRFAINTKILVALLLIHACCYGVSVYNRDTNNYQLLQAIWNKDQYTASTLIEKGADVNVADDRNRTALIWAIEMNDPFLVQTILSHGAKVNLRDSQGRTALTWANYTGNGRVLTMLRKAGATY